MTDNRRMSMTFFSDTVLTADLTIEADFEKMFFCLTAIKDLL